MFCIVRLMKVYTASYFPPVSSVYSAVMHSAALPLTCKYGCHEEITASCCCCCFCSVRRTQISENEVSTAECDLATQ